MDQTTLRPKPMPGQNPGQTPGADPGTHLKYPGKRWARGLGKGLGRGQGLGAAPGKPRAQDEAQTRAPGNPPAKGHRPHAARRRGRRLTTLLFGLLFAAVLVLSGVGLGTVSATVIGMSKLAEMQKEAAASGATAAGPPAGAPVPEPPASASKPSTGKRPGTSPERPAAQAESGPRPPAAGSRAATLGVEAVDAPSGAGALLVGVHIPGPGHSAGLVRGDTVLTFAGTRIDSAADLATAVTVARPGRVTTLTVRHENGARQSLSVRPGFVT
ncbi:PDZ domain-containing protein [Streptomyces sp. NPDC041068]|uniref:PDZ domain-containing protein n=1 Tax=Streptomyces sp. NPDC041068 TaxID=3155130 RepID=UPI0033E7C152